MKIREEYCRYFSSDRTMFNLLKTSKTTEIYCKQSMPNLGKCDVQFNNRSQIKQLPLRILSIENKYSIEVSINTGHLKLSLNSIE